jgi:hypothetical protein
LLPFWVLDALKFVADLNPEFSDSLDTDPFPKMILAINREQGISY